MSKTDHLQHTRQDLIYLKQVRDAELDCQNGSWSERSNFILHTLDRHRSHEVAYSNAVHRFGLAAGRTNDLTCWNADTERRPLPISAFVRSQRNCNDAALVCGDARHDYIRSPTSLFMSYRCRWLCPIDVAGSKHLDHLSNWHSCRIGQQCVHF